MIDVSKYAWEPGSLFINHGRANVGDVGMVPPGAIWAVLAGRRIAAADFDGAVVAVDLGGRLAKELALEPWESDQTATCMLRMVEGASSRAWLHDDVGRLLVIPFAPGSPELVYGHDLSTFKALCAAIEDVVPPVDWDGEWLDGLPLDPRRWMTDPGRGPGERPALLRLKA